MNVLYVTATLPFGRPEAFLIPEITCVGDSHPVTIVPVRPRGTVVHTDAVGLASRTLQDGLLSAAIVRGAVCQTAVAPAQTLSTLTLLLRSRTPRILVKNLAVFPKGLWLARTTTQLDIDHIHAHWASTSATVAMVAARVSGTPWSFTAHRWDIAEDNLLRVKVADARFVRAISRRGARSIAARTSGVTPDIEVMHVGVALPDRVSQTPSDGFRVVAIADLVDVKGHRYLIEAIASLRAAGSRVELDLAGDGPLRQSLTAQVEQAGLGRVVRFMGTQPHADLLAGLAAGRWDAAVVPSVRVGDVEEGIPVSLMEAMAAGVPVVSTRTGGIQELIDERTGLLVDGGDADGLAQALGRLERDHVLRHALAREGRARVERAFNVRSIAAALIDRFAESS